MSRARQTSLPNARNEIVIPKPPRSTLRLHLHVLVTFSAAPTGNKILQITTPDGITVLDTYISETQLEQLYPCVLPAGKGAVVSVEAGGGVITSKLNVGYSYIPAPGGLVNSLPGQRDLPYYGI
jgi:hypothetical protein